MSCLIFCFNSLLPVGWFFIYGQKLRWKIKFHHQPNHFCIFILLTQYPCFIIALCITCFPVNICNVPNYTSIVEICYLLTCLHQKNWSKWIFGWLSHVAYHEFIRMLVVSQKYEPLTVFYDIPFVFFNLNIWMIVNIV